MQVAGDRGVFGPLEMSVRAPEEISNGERVLGARRLEPPLAVGRRRGLTQAGWRARALHSLGAHPAAGRVPTGRRSLDPSVAASSGRQRQAYGSS